HLAQLIFVLWYHYRQSRHHAEVSKVKDPVVSWPVLPNDSGTINGKDNRKFLQTDIMHDLVESALQKSRINSHDRLHPRPCQTTRDGDRMSCRYPHFHEACRIGMGKTLEPGACRHRSCNGLYAVV